MKLSMRLGSDTNDHTCSIGARTVVLASTLICTTETVGVMRSRRSSQYRKLALGCKRVERLLHQTRQVVIDVVDVRVLSELRSQIDRRKRLDRELGRERDVTQHVTHVEPPRQRKRDREDLEAEQPVEPQHPREPLTPSQEQRGL